MRQTGRAARRQSRPASTPRGAERDPVSVNEAFAPDDGSLRWTASNSLKRSHGLTRWPATNGQPAASSSRARACSNWSATLARRHLQRSCTSALACSARARRRACASRCNARKRRPRRRRAPARSARATTARRRRRRRVGAPPRPRRRPHVRRAPAPHANRRMTDNLAAASEQRDVPYLRLEFDHVALVLRAPPESLTAAAEQLRRDGAHAAEPLRGPAGAAVSSRPRAAGAAPPTAAAALRRRAGAG